MDINKIREDFPVLKGNLVYFDSACMTLRPKQVIEVIQEYYKEYPACAGRSVHKLSNRVEEKYQESRKAVQKFISARKQEEIIFTRNTTEGINLVSRSLGLKRGDVVLTTDREHNSNLIPWQVLSKRIGIVHKIVKSRENHAFNLEAFKDRLTPEVKLVSVVHSSNLDGYTLPVEEIIKLSKENGSLVMLDSAQAVPHRKIDVKKLGVDFLAFSGHKMLGPSGTGVLYGKLELLEKLDPFMVGGHTVQNSTYESHVLEKIPERFEAGLQNYAGVIGLTEAVKYLERVGMDNIEKHETRLNTALKAGLQEMGIEIVGVKDPNLTGGVTSFLVKGLKYHDVAIIMSDNYNIMLRSGQHCVHSWFNQNNIEGSVRASLYIYNTMEEVESFLGAVKEISKLG